MKLKITAILVFCISVASAQKTGQSFESPVKLIKPNHVTEYYNTIQGAIAAATTGGNIKIAPGDYVISSSIIIDSSNITIEGSGMTTRLIVDAGLTGLHHTAITVNSIADTSFVNPPYGVGFRRMSNITIRDLYIDHQGSTQTIGQFWGAIWISCVDNLTLENVYVNDAAGSGFNVRGCRFVTMNNCVVDSCVSIGAANAFNIVGRNQADPGGYVMISHCIAKYAADLGFCLGGFNDTKITLSGCQAIGCGQGIEIEHGESYDQMVSITGCLADSCTYVGIAAAHTGAVSDTVYKPSGKSFVISNNIVNGRNIPTSVGIRLSDWGIVCTGNVIDGVSTGIYYTDILNHDSTGSLIIAVNSITMMDSTLEPAIKLRKGSSRFLKDLVISSNIINGSRAGNAAGIYLSGNIRNGIINDNSISNTSGSGIFLLNSPEWISIEGNHIKNVGRGGSSAYYNSGIAVYDTASNLSMKRNVVLDTRDSVSNQYGVYIGAHATKVWITSNDLRGANSLGIYEASGSQVWKSDNILDSAAGPEPPLPSDLLRNVKLGGANLIRNGGFDSAGVWDVNGVTISAGVASWPADSAYPGITDTLLVALSSDSTYRLEFDVSDCADSSRIAFMDYDTHLPYTEGDVPNSGTEFHYYKNGHYEITVRKVNSTRILIGGYTKDGLSSFSLDDISLVNTQVANPNDVLAYRSGWVNTDSLNIRTVTVDELLHLKPYTGTPSAPSSGGYFYTHSGGGVAPDTLFWIDSQTTIKQIAP